MDAYLSRSTNLYCLRLSHCIFGGAVEPQLCDSQGTARQRVYARLLFTFKQGGPGCGKNGKLAIEIVGMGIVNFSTKLNECGCCYWLYFR
jgi:hypothetical protein